MASLYIDIPDPPCDETFGTYQEAYDVVQDHGKSHGYYVVLKRSKPDGKDVPKRAYHY